MMSFMGGNCQMEFFPYTYVCDRIYLTLHLRVRVFVCSLFTCAVVNRVVGIASYLNMEIYYIQSAALRK